MIKKERKKKKDGRVSDRTPFTLRHPFSSNVLNETFPFLTSGTWVFNPIAVSKAMSNKEPRFQAHRSLSRATAVFTLLPRYAPPFPSCNHTTGSVSPTPYSTLLSLIPFSFHLARYQFEPLLSKEGFERTFATRS